MMEYLSDEIASNKNIRKELFKGAKLWALLCGLIFIAIAHSLPKIVQTIKNGRDENSLLLTFGNFLESHSDKLFYAGIIQIGLGVSLYLIFISMHKFWKSHIDPYVTNHINKLEAILHSSGKHAQEIINENSLELAVRHSDPKAVKAVLKTAYSRAYGSHCAKPKGLYEAIQNNVGKFLEPNTPHRSTNRQHIVISAAEGGKFLWKETTSYLLHTIAYDTDFDTPSPTNESISYNFTTSTSAQYSDLDNLSLKIYVDGKIIADTTGRLDRLEFNAEGIAILDKGVIEVKKVSDELRITVQKELKINKPEVKIKIEEVSIIEESFFVARRDQPVCGQTVNIQIPENYKFDYLAVPPGVENPEETTELHRNIKIDGWVMPGIIFSCQWSPK